MSLIVKSQRLVFGGKSEYPFIKIWDENWKVNWHMNSITWCGRDNRVTTITDSNSYYYYYSTITITITIRKSSLYPSFSISFNRLQYRIHHLDHKSFRKNWIFWYEKDYMVPTNIDSCNQTLTTLTVSKYLHTIYPVFLLTQHCHVTS